MWIISVHSAIRSLGKWKPSIKCKIKLQMSTSLSPILDSLQSVKPFLPIQIKKPQLIVVWFPSHGNILLILQRKSFWCKLMNYDLQIPGTFDPEDECYEVESIIERWPRYQRVLNFMKTEVPLEGIRFFLDFLRDFCRTNFFETITQFSTTATPLGSGEIRRSWTYFGQNWFSASC